MHRTTDMLHGAQSRVREQGERALSDLGCHFWVDSWGSWVEWEILFDLVDHNCFAFGGKRKGLVELKSDCAPTLHLLGHIVTFGPMAKLIYNRSVMLRSKHWLTFPWLLYSKTPCICTCGLAKNGWWHSCTALTTVKISGICGNCSRRVLTAVAIGLWGLLMISSSRESKEDNHFYSS